TAAGRGHFALGNPRHVARHGRPVRAIPRLLARRGQGHGHHHPRPHRRRKRRGGRAFVEPKRKERRNAVNNFFTASLGACLGFGLLLLIYRKCERRLDSGAWSWMFGAFVFGLLYYLALQV